MPHFLIICLNNPSQLTSDRMNEYSATFNSKPSKSTKGTANATPENNVISRFIKRDTCFFLFISSAFLINKKVSTLTENINAKSMLAANKSNILFITSYSKFRL